MYFVTPSLAEVIILSFATYIPDTKPIVSTRNRNTTRYFFQSPISSFGILLIRGFLIFFFFIAAPLPFQIFRGYLVCIDVVVAHRTVTELDHMVCHIFDRLVMCNHNDSISVFFVDLLNQL